MRTAEIIQRTTGLPATVESLAAELSALGLPAASSVLVHSSLSSMGWVVGGAAAVVLALERVLTSKGTLVMPTHSAELSDPAEWRNPPVPEAWWERIRQQSPAYDVHLTPSSGMGAIPECFRKQKGTLRSEHPQVSFAAWGAQAREMTAGHTLDFGLGDGSPLARLYDKDGLVLLLGVGHESNTSLHLAEYRCPTTARHVKLCRAPVRVDGERHWAAFQDVDIDASDFPAIGGRFAAETGLVTTGRVAQAPALLMPQRALVDFAVRLLPELRA
jgi:aminoglycoside 3-N-acetyltransferase